MLQFFSIKSKLTFDEPFELHLYIHNDITTQSKESQFTIQRVVTLYSFTSFPVEQGHVKCGIINLQ